MSFFTAKVLAWIAGVLGVVIIGMGVALWAQEVRVGKAQNERDAANNLLAEATKTIKGQKETLQKCSDATDALKAAGDANKAEAAQELARLRKLAEKYQASDRRLALLTAGPTPSGAGCATALGAIRRELRK